MYSVLYLFLFLDLVEFTDEEGYGKFLDMHVLHDQYLNLKKLEVSVRSLTQNNYEWSSIVQPC